MRTRGRPRPLLIVPCGGGAIDVELRPLAPYIDGSCVSQIRGRRLEDMATILVFITLLISSFRATESKFACNLWQL